MSPAFAEQGHVSYTPTGAGVTREFRAAVVRVAGGARRSAERFASANPSRRQASTRGLKPRCPLFPVWVAAAMATPGRGWICQPCLRRGEPPILPVKVWSAHLEEEFWEFATELPQSQWPQDASVYTRAEVNVRQKVGRRLWAACML